ncbi:Ig-like domain-containing protein [Synergistaceae bacterium OttesenSCG-928-D05]|nr:Ig-like domain-containing protein [Synergistaceae bacterium OttesenSCG-928-D05]
MNVRKKKYLGLFLIGALLLLFCVAPSHAAPKVESFALRDTYIKIYDDESYQIHFTVFPANAEWERTEYFSEDSWVASVSQTGRVYGHREGDTWIVVRIVNYDGTTVSQQLKVRVYDDWGWGGIYIGGGGCSAAQAGWLAFLLPVFAAYIIRRK